MMNKAGIENVQETAHILNYSAGTEAWQSMYDNARIGLELMRPSWSKPVSAKRRRWTA